MVSLRLRAAGTLAVLAAVTAAGLAGCDAEVAGSPAPASGPGTTEGPLPGSGPAEHVAYTGAHARAHRPASQPAALVPTGLRFGVHRGFDRVVVELRGSGTPGWRVRYVGRPHLAGTATLEIDVRGVVPATAARGDTWSGPTDLAPQTGNVVEEVRRGARHDGVQQVVVGVDARRPFRVFALTDPTRVVVDVRRPAPPHFRGPLNGVPPLDQSTFPVTRAPDTQTGSDDARLSPKNLRLGYHHTFERLVLGVRGPGDPGWRAEYVADPVLPGSGAHLAIAGGTVLRIRVTGVVPPTAHRYRGPQRFRPHGDGPVAEVVYGRVRDGAVDVYVGVAAERPFRVFEARHPTRVVIDVER